MIIRFVNPVFLPWLALGALPVLIHLFAKARPPLLRFSSVRFLQRILKTQDKVKRPRDLLLLILRVLAILLLVCLFARPKMLKGVPADPADPRQLVIIVDASASMGYVDGGQTRFAVAAAKGAGLLANLRGGDRANVIWLKRDPEAVFPELGVNMPHLRQALRKGAPTLERGDPERALKMAVTMLEGCGEAEIAVISDFQRTAWHAIQVPIPETIRVTAISLAANAAPNMSVQRLRTTPSLPLAGQTTRVTCDVANWGGNARTAQVLLSAGENHQKQEVSVAGGDIQPVQFDCVFPAGENRIVMSIGEDEFAADNQLVGVLQVTPSLRVGILSGDARVVDAWRRVINAFPWMQASVLSPPVTAIPDDIAILIADRWEGDHSLLAQRVDSGGSLLWCPGAVSAESGQLILPAAPAVDIQWQRADGSPWRLSPAAGDSPILTLFQTGQYGDLSAPAFIQRAQLPSSWKTRVSTILTYDDGVMALGISHRNSSSVVIWNMPVEETSGSFAMHGEELLQLFGETVRHCRRGQGLQRTETPGARLILRRQSGELSKMVLRTPRMDPLPVAIRATADGVTAISERVKTPGFHEWRFDGNPVETVPVIIDPLESDMRVIEKTDIKTMLADSVMGRGDDLSWLREGRSLWPTALVALALTILAEGTVLVLTGRKNIRNNRDNV
ncbi:MAG: BatA domain-containing protein [Lentisphaeria bacterium]|nr:BatA domain-containing protein [Lentisphaeria bacterium]